MLTLLLVPADLCVQVWGLPRSCKDSVLLVLELPVGVRRELESGPWEDAQRASVLLSTGLLCDKNRKPALLVGHEL